ncbi:hypothetical protein [Accumulibacter sp.]|uniref:hypothetical protein n=1 Tax=Accumulibacter sp. TaxID=2053492 RepID=UPI00262E3E04|nr:hypothetical protein [Accumulibacter sp.]
MQHATKSQTAAAASAINLILEGLSDADAGVRQADEEIRRLSGAPASKDEILNTLRLVVEEQVRAARLPISDGLLAMSRNSSSANPIRLLEVANGMIGRLQSGKYLELGALKSILLASLGTDLIMGAIQDAADLVDWPSALSAADRVRQIAAANRHRDTCLEKADALRQQADAAGFAI